MPKRTWIYPGMVILLVLSMLLVACGDKVQAVPTAASPDYIQLLSGSYTTRIGNADARFYLDPQIPDRYTYTGDWELLLKTDGKYQVSLNQIMIGQGNYNLTSDELIFEDGVWDNSCASTGQEARAVYNWLFDGAMLSFNPKSESCMIRSFVLTISPLVIAK